MLALAIEVDLARTGGANCLERSVQVETCSDGDLYPFPTNLRFEFVGSPSGNDTPLRSTQGDLTALLQEVKHLLEPWKVPVKGVISDGEEAIGSAVTFVFPDVPHQLCQFHYLKDATKPLYEADRSAKTELKKQLRGVRPIERALEEHPTPENEAIRGYCLAVRASLTDDGRSPLDAPGLRLYKRVTRDSTTPLGTSRKKKLAPGFEAVIPTRLQGAAGHGGIVALLTASLAAGAPGRPDPGQ